MKFKDFIHNNKKLTLDNNKLLVQQQKFAYKIQTKNMLFSIQLQNNQQFCSNTY